VTLYVTLGDVWRERVAMFKFRRRSRNVNIQRLLNIRLQPEFLRRISGYSLNIASGVNGKPPFIRVHSPAATAR